ncbi:MAG: threonylcarbamoyl-AMP synthase [Firmicutes bacterium]|nr:threonylcarbamoyl-AMP synthase [Bacillota bacterium]
MELVETKVLSPNQLAEAVRLLQQGEVVAFPTETVYGLGANALDPQAVARIFQAKGRPQDNPLIVHCTGITQVSQFVQEISPEVRLVMDAFWPGPLTIVLKKTDIIPTVVTAGLDTVAVRVPNHPLALELLSNTNFPLAAPSANTSGRPSPTRAEHVFSDLQGKIPAILDGGETGWGLESTVLDCTVTPFRVLRPGGVTLEELSELVPVALSEDVAGQSEIPRSPGMKYQHYAPEAEVFLVSGDNSAAQILQLSESYFSKGQAVGVMTWNERAELFPKLKVLPMGPQGDLHSLANKLYHLLREADVLGLDVLFIESVDEERLGLAIMNRLRKAAKNRELRT